MNLKRSCSTIARGVAVLAAFCGAAPKPAVGKVGNLLANPSFEQKAGDEVHDWKKRAWAGKADARWSLESTGRTGKQCVSIRSEKGSDAAWWTTVTVNANAFYRLSGWIKTENVHGAVGALLNIQNMRHVRTPPVAGTADWTRVSTVFHTGKTTKLEINCLFGGWGRSTGQAWYDDVAVEPVADLPAGTQAAVTIDTDAESVPYSPMIFGGFIEHFHRQIYGGLFEPGSPLSDERGFRKDVIAAMKELKLSIVRWPGGCFASGYRWTDGVGKTRKPTPDPVWGVIDPNTFGTDEFVEWCRRVGCEPYICTNAGNGTPQEMKQWVEYCNRTDGRRGKTLNVRYWSIGNENWGGHEIGRKTPKTWGPMVRKSAEMMLAVDPKLVLVAAATPNRDWTLPLLEAAGRHLDYVAVHQYWLGNWQKNAIPDYLTCILLSDGPQRTISRVIAILQEAGCRGRIKIAFDEWNLRGWHHPGFPRKRVSDNSDPAVAKLIENRDKNAIASQYTMADALFSASFLNACLRHAKDVGMANIAPIVNTRGPLFVHPKGVVKRTTFHTLAMYANLLEARLAKLDVKAGALARGKQWIPVIDAIATVNASGTAWSIALINRHPSEAVACTVKMKNVPLDGQYNATILAGDSCDAFNDVENPNRVVPQRKRLTFSKGIVNLPPHSLTIVKITKGKQ
jgi:alpha-N-arabinofuranosidase